MRKIALAAALAAGIAAPAHADDDALVAFHVLTPEIATELAVAAMEHCRAEGYQVGVAVVDRFGGLQVFVRDRFAGAHTVETARRKAWTAVSFRTDTSDLDGVTKPGGDSYGIRFISEALPLGGGMMVEASGQMVAGIGVSGAPGPELDDDCAAAGIAAITEALPF